MVMHARKTTQRMNDGYFEKHQSHPYQNTSKYNSGTRFDRLRDSPNGTYRSDSPESSSPQRCHSKTYSAQKSSSSSSSRDNKEREARDYKSRDKHTDCARSPKDGGKRGRDSDHRTNHDRDDKSLKGGGNRDRERKSHNNCDKRDDRDRLTRVGDWSEHTSSSGKKYYYNCKTEVSQWEKPREWIERERDRFRRSRDRDYGGRSGHDKQHSNAATTRKESSSSSSTTTRHWSRSGSETRHSKPDDHSQDMDISPGDGTPPPGDVALLRQASPPVMVPPPNPVGSAGGPPSSVGGLRNELDGCQPTEMSMMMMMNHNGLVGDGPPTPTHSETADCGKAAVPLEAPQNIATIVVPPTALPPMQAVVVVASSLQALRPQGPSITPSLANYYKDDLVGHVRGWPAEILEKQAEKLAQDANVFGNIQCAKVSAELKSARSLVRLTEIQATLQEQRILFLRQQIKSLEEMKAQNSFMSEDG